MATVHNQLRDHPMMPLLSKYLDTQQDIDRSTARGKPWKPRGEPRKVLNSLGTAIFQHCVEKWNALPQEAKIWYNENAPPEFCTGFLWWTWSCLIKNYGAGPWTVNASSIGGHTYVVPEAAPEGIWAIGYMDATEIGTLAHIDWEPGCPSEILPILLVHGWYPDTFDPADVWSTMTLALTSLNPLHADSYTLVYDPDHPGDPSYALKCLEGDGRTLYISNYTHAPQDGTPGDIRQYAASLAREIALVVQHTGAPHIDLLTHSMGGLVARAYVENADLVGNPWPAPYQGDVRGVIMMAPPNQGSLFRILYPGWWDWQSVLQMEADSEFLAQLNAGTTGKAQGVVYHIIAGNPYSCEQLKAAPPFPLTLFIPEADRLFHVGEPTTIPYHAHRLCEVSGRKPNDGEVLTEQTVLWEQAGQPEVAPANYHVYKFNHWAMRGVTLAPCEAATLVKIILAEYDVAKWRAKGKDIEPPQVNWIQRALYLIKTSESGLSAYNYIADHDISLPTEDLSGGALAQYVASRNAILIDPDAEAESHKVLAAHIVREVERARWPSASSLYQVYYTFLVMAEFWNEVKKGDPIPSSTPGPGSSPRGSKRP